MLELDERDEVGLGDATDELAAAKTGGGRSAFRSAVELDRAVGTPVTSTSESDELHSSVDLSALSSMFITSFFALNCSLLLLLVNAPGAAVRLLSLARVRRRGGGTPCWNSFEGGLITDLMASVLCMCVVYQFFGTRKKTKILIINICRQINGVEY